MLTNEDLSEEKRKEKVEIYIYLYKVKRRQIIKPESILRSNFLNNLKLRLQKYQENVAFLAELKIKILFKHASLIKYIFFCFFRASFSCEFSSSVRLFFSTVFISIDRVTCQKTSFVKFYVNFNNWFIFEIRGWI